MPFFSEKPASSSQVHEFLLPGGRDGLRACEEQSSIPEKWRMRMSCVKLLSHCRPCIFFSQRGPVSHCNLHQDRGNQISVSGPSSWTLPVHTIAHSGYSFSGNRPGCHPTQRNIKHCLLQAFLLSMPLPSANTPLALVSETTSHRPLHPATQGACSYWGSWLGHTDGGVEDPSPVPGCSLGLCKPDCLPAEELLGWPRTQIRSSLWFGKSTPSHNTKRPAKNICPTTADVTCQVSALLDFNLTCTTRISKNLLSSSCLL